MKNSDFEVKVSLYKIGAFNEERTKDWEAILNKNITSSKSKSAMISRIKKDIGYPSKWSCIDRFISSSPASTDTSIDFTFDLLPEVSKAKTFNVIVLYAIYKEKTYSTLLVKFVDDFEVNSDNNFIISIENSALPEGSLPGILNAINGVEKE